MRVSKGKRWSEHEDELLHKIWPIATKEELELLLGRSFSSCQSRASKLKIRRTTKVFGISGFLPLSNANEYWVYGLLLSDGCLHLNKKNPKHSKIMLGSKDYEIPLKIQAVLGWGSLYARSEDFFIWEGKSKLACDRCLEVGIIPNKSRQMQVDKISGILEDAYFGDLLRGLWDGDGTVTEKDIVLYSGDFLFLEWIKEKLSKMEIKSSISTSRRDNTHRLRLMKESYVSAYNLIYKNDLCLVRKKQKWDAVLSCL